MGMLNENDQTLTTEFGSAYEVLKGRRWKCLILGIGNSIKRTYLSLLNTNAVKSF